MKSFQEAQRNYLQAMKREEKEELEKNAGVIHSFKQLVKTSGVDLIDDNFKYVRTIGVIATYPNLVEILCSDFQKDKEGLVDFKLLNSLYEKKQFADGFLYSQNFMLIAHPYFRRGFYETANFAPNFIHLFWDLNDVGIDTFISLDYDRVRINIDSSMYMEKDTWYGANFSKDIATITDGITKLRPPLGVDGLITRTFFPDSYSLDIMWETKNEIKSFQAEEFNNENIKVNIKGIDFHPVRYVHAEFDLKTNNFRHFDGAIHFYTDEEYFARRDSDFNYNSKNSVQIKSYSEKLFKMNGKVTADMWIEFTSHFFTGNYLIFEYFEGKYPDWLSEDIEKVRVYREKNPEG
jgi:hypothetical protein